MNPMGNPQLLLRAAAAAVLVTGALALAGCSRPTPSPGQATAAPQGQPPAAGYPSSVPATGPKPGEPGYPPPNPMNPTPEDPYPGKTATAAAAVGGTATTEAPAATATP
jgi:hypothetical protein